MKYRLIVRGEAKADVQLAARRYELQRPGLGREFMAELDAALNRVSGNRFQYQVLHRETRRAIVHRFPYGAFYRIEGNNLVVFCLIHLHQDPASWKSRVPE